MELTANETLSIIQCANIQINVLVELLNSKFPVNMSNRLRLEGLDVPPPNFVKTIQRDINLLTQLSNDPSKAIYNLKRDNISLLTDTIFNFIDDEKSKWNLIHKLSLLSYCNQNQN